MIVSPPVFTIAARRHPVGPRRAAQPGRRGPAYRLIIEEVPEAAPGRRHPRRACGSTCRSTRWSRPARRPICAGRRRASPTAAGRSKRPIPAPAMSGSTRKRRPAPPASRFGDDVAFGTVLPGATRQWQFGGVDRVADRAVLQQILRNAGQWRVRTAQSSSLGFASFLLLLARSARLAARAEATPAAADALAGPGAAHGDAERHRRGRAAPVPAGGGRRALRRRRPPSRLAAAPAARRTDPVRGRALLSARLVARPRRRVSTSRSQAVAIDAGIGAFERAARHRSAAAEDDADDARRRPAASRLRPVRRACPRRDQRQRRVRGRAFHPHGVGSTSFVAQAGARPRAGDPARDRPGRSTGRAA